jgi:hypothetical protein
MNGETMLRQTADIVAARRKAYGEASTLLDQIARRWSLTLGTKVTAAQVALCLIDLKLSRLTTDPAHADSIMDVAGYAACLAEVTS